MRKYIADDNFTKYMYFSDKNDETKSGAEPLNHSVHLNVYVRVTVSFSTELVIPFSSITI